MKTFRPTPDRSKFTENSPHSFYHSEVDRGTAPSYTPPIHLYEGAAFAAGGFCIEMGPIESAPDGRHLYTWLPVDSAARIDFDGATGSHNDENREVCYAQAEDTWLRLLRNWSLPRTRR